MLIFRKHTFLTNKKDVFLSSIFSIIVLFACIFVNIKINQNWTSDNYDGFMDIGGKLTLAGIWHLVFSIIISFVIVWLLVINFYFIFRKCYKKFQYAFNTWKIVVGFTSLSFFDVVYRFHKFNTFNLDFLYFIFTEWHSFTTLFLSVSLLITLLITNKLILKYY